MSLRNRNETKLLVENWRNLLVEGFNDENSEQLEEGVREKAIAGLAALMALVPKPAIAKPISAGDAQKIAVELVEKEVGRYDGVAVKLTVEVLSSVDAENTDLIIQKVLKPWLGGAVKKAYERGMLDDSASIDSTRSILKSLLEEKIDSVTQDFAKASVEDTDSGDKKGEVSSKKLSGLSSKALDDYKAAVAAGNTNLQKRILDTYRSRR
jgi:hypothetical protein